MENPAKQADIKWSKATLRIFSKTIDPSEIGKRLGLEATKTHAKGALRSPRHEAVWPTSMWSLNSPLSDHSDMTDHLRYLLDLLEPKMQALEHLARDCKIDLFCGFSSGNGQGGFVLDPLTLSRLAALKIPITFDLYPPSVSVEDAGDEPINSYLNRTAGDARNN